MNAILLIDIYIGNSKIEIIGSCNFHELILDKYLTFKEHLDYLVKKISTIIYFMKKV